MRAYDSSSCYSNSRLDDDDASNNTFDHEVNGSSAKLSNETSEGTSYCTSESYRREGPLVFLSVLGGSLRNLLEIAENNDPAVKMIHTDHLITRRKIIMNTVTHTPHHIKYTTTSSTSYLSIIIKF